jgi:ABC-type dipeptide/oligopeptide/nickel transport system ATPase subunit
MTIDVQVDDRGSTGREPDPSDLLVVDNLTVTFPTDDGLVKAVRGVSYTVRAGDSLGIVGESGSGKSVSSMAVMGLLPKNARLTGSIKFRGRELIGLSEKEFAQLRGNKIAMIFQDPLTSLNPVSTCRRTPPSNAPSNCSASSASRSRSSGSTTIRTNCRVACDSASSSRSR